MANPTFSVEALKTDIRAALVNEKAHAAPIAMRVAWHASGTFDKSDNTGGSNGATMRFEPEISDDANAGLHIVRYMLFQVKKKYPQVSMADLWTYAGCVAIEFMGGPKIPFGFGRSDDADGAACPANGRLPDAGQGAQHLRDVFHRMGFNDQEIVALSGGHTVGRCHAVRSGFDGPWTHNPTTFDNAYFVHLLEYEWTPRQWDGPLQYTDPSDSLLMLPTDLALIQDDAFKPHVERYAADENVFFTEFAAAYGKLMALGCPAECQPGAAKPEADAKSNASAEFREYAMHGSVHAMKKLVASADVHELEKSSARSALHKSAFWGHVDASRYLIEELKLDINGKDIKGDTPLHDAIRYGQSDVAQLLIASGADLTIANAAGETPHILATDRGQDTVAKAIAAKL